MDRTGTETPDVRAVRARLWNFAVIRMGDPAKRQRTKEELWLQDKSRTKRDLQALFEAQTPAEASAPPGAAPRIPPAVQAFPLGGGRYLLPNLFPGEARLLADRNGQQPLFFVGIGETEPLFCSMAFERFERRGGRLGYERVRTCETADPAVFDAFLGEAGLHGRVFCEILPRLRLIRDAEALRAALSPREGRTPGSRWLDRSAAYGGWRE